MAKRIVLGRQAFLGTGWVADSQEKERVAGETSNQLSRFFCGEGGRKEIAIMSCNVHRIKMNTPLERPKIYRII